MTVFATDRPFILLIIDEFQQRYKGEFVELQK